MVCWGRAMPALLPKLDIGRRAINVSVCSGGEGRAYRVDELSWRSCMSDTIWPAYVGFSTPYIPEEIRAIRHPDYKNIFEYELRNENLWGTETLFGDWSGHTLIVAKDFY